MLKILVEEGDRITAGRVLAIAADQSTGRPDPRRPRPKLLPRQEVVKRLEAGTRLAGDRAGSRRGGGDKSHSPEFDA